MKAREQRGIEEEPALAPALDVEQRQIAARGGRQLAVIEHMDDEKIVALCEERFEPCAPAARIEEVAQQDDETGAREKPRERTHRRAEARLAFDRQRREEAEERKNLLFAAS